MTSIVEKTPALIRYADGRERCRLTHAGRLEYARRKQAMFLRDGGLCCLCGQPCAYYDVTFEHKNGRGMGGAKRTDVISENGIAHCLGQSAKGSISYEKYMERPLEQRILACRGAR
jgi:hypothetical protein